ncbi:hypothetical protein HYU15_00125, partial [Candidatus Woesearchaeota archaeon]|nr:hypothetical protein [Candidatus Woesearchaeota archaeon]
MAADISKERVLQQLGLTEAEARLYMTLLSSGEATASALAKKTATNRTFTYDRLNHLVNLGLASHVVKDGKRYFSAANPSQFLALLKDREAQLQAVLPQLEALKSKPSLAPGVTVFSSRKGVQAALNLVLKERKPVFVHGSLLGFRRVMSQGFDIWNQRRARAMIMMRVLTPEDTTNLELSYAEARQLAEEERAATTTFTFG